MAYKKAGQYLTEAEWQVMECVWEKAPCTGREVWEWFQGRTTWSRSTPLPEQKEALPRKSLTSSMSC